MVLAGLGNDLVTGGTGNDIVAGGAGRDLLDGGLGDDVVAGSGGHDFAHGGGGDDLLVDGLGYDIMTGDRGGDAFLYVEATLQGGRNATDGGVFVGGQGDDTLYLAVSDQVQARVAAQLVDGAASQHLASIGVVTHGIEDFVFVDPSDPASGIVTEAQVAEADLWGMV